MKFSAAVCTLVVMVLALVFASTRNDEAPDRVEVAALNPDNWRRFAPEGKEVDAIYGDVVLRNRHLTAVIAQPLASRNANMTVKDVGGALIDLTVRDRQSDQLSAFYPGRRNDPFRAWTVAADGKPVDLETAADSSGESASVTVRAEGTESRPAVEVTYRLDAGSRHLTVTTKYANTAEKPLSVTLEDDIRADGGKEDMAKSPNDTSDLFWIHDRYWGQAYGVDADKWQIQANSNSRTSVLKYLDGSGSDTVTLEPGQSYELTRRVFPGASLLDVKAVAAANRGRTCHPVNLLVQDGKSRPIPRARIELSKGGREYGTATADDEGAVDTSLPAGTYTLKVSALGIVVGDGLSIKVLEGKNQFEFELAKYAPGTVVAKISEESGEAIPCKVEFIPKGDLPRPDFGPETAEFAVKNLRYAPQGEFEQSLPPGRYEVIVSRGPEYDAIFTELTVAPGKSVPLRGKLVRSVKTPGWISSDFHSHSSPSGDNTSSQLGRVLNLVCEHIEFAPCTEHNRVSTYQPHIDRLKIGPFMSTVSGMELTGQPLPLNHQNAFPLEYKPHTQDGGAPLTDTDPERQIERLALWDGRSEKLIQQNHPDIGWLFFDKDGDGEPDDGYSRSFALMDVIEIHPVEQALTLEPTATRGSRTMNNRIFNWLQLLNQGYRIPGVVNTDAHYNYHGSGGLRNWIESPTDDPAKIDPMDVVHAAEQGRLIMSNGPYLEVSLREAGSKVAVTAGEDLTARSGRVQLDIRVQCPNWFDVDRVFVLVNGRVHPDHSYTRQGDPDRFRSSVVKFDERLELELKSDAHVVVVAGGEKRTLGKVLGPSWGEQPPTAVSNPIYVDVDSGGFRPNRDTLGHPLPVKYGAKKGS